MPRRARGEDGAALAEFAVCLPFLAVLVFGTIDLGRLFETQQRLKGAAREGAAFGARFPGRQTSGATCQDPDTIVWRANNEGRGYTVLVNGATPTCSTGTLPASLQPGQPLKITVRTTFSTFTPFAATIFGAHPTLTSSICVNIAGATPDPAVVCP